MDRSRESEVVVSGAAIAVGGGLALKALDYYSRCWQTNWKSRRIPGLADEIYSLASPPPDDSGAVLTSND